MVPCILQYFANYSKTFTKLNYNSVRMSWIEQFLLTKFVTNVEREPRRQNGTRTAMRYISDVGLVSNDYILETATSAEQEFFRWHNWWFGFIKSEIHLRKVASLVTNKHIDPFAKREKRRPTPVTFKSSVCCFLSQIIDKYLYCRQNGSSKSQVSHHNGHQLLVQSNLTDFHGNVSDKHEISASNIHRNGTTYMRHVFVHR